MQNYLAPIELDFGSLIYKCNICGANCMTQVPNFGRETPSCHNCGSTVRMRSIVHCLSVSLFGDSLAIEDFPVRKDIVGIGMSDWEPYGSRLAEKLSYTNTYYHKQPKFDITDISTQIPESLDFIISTDVFEHVSPPVSIAFDNTYKMLKQGGAFNF